MNKRNKKTLEIGPDILDTAGQFHPKKKVSALRARELFEKHYERR